MGNQRSKEQTKENGIATTPTPCPFLAGGTNQGDIEEVGRFFQEDDSSDIGSLVLHCHHLVHDAMLFFMESSKIYKSIITSWMY